MEQTIIELWKEANEYLGVFGAKSAFVDVYCNSGEAHFSVSFFKDSIDSPGKEYIFLSGQAKSFEDCIKKCFEKAGIEYKSLKQNAA